LCRKLNNQAISQLEKLRKRRISILSRVVGIMTETDIMTSVCKKVDNDSG
jgi:hypothetical protein